MVKITLQFGRRAEGRRWVNEIAPQKVLAALTLMWGSSKMSSDFEQASTAVPSDIPEGLQGVDLANRQRRVALALVLDTSYSMSGEKIAALQEGVDLLATELRESEQTRQAVEVAVLAFGGDVRLECEFTSVDTFVPPRLSAGGGTPMGEALVRSVSIVNERKELYKKSGLDYYQPWIFLFTDGQPTDDIGDAAGRIRALQEQKRLNFFAVGVGEADVSTLRRISRNEPKMLRENKFRELFAWLGASMESVSTSRPGEKVSLPSTGGWEAEA